MADVSRTTIFLLVLGVASALLAFAVVALEGPTPGSPPVGPPPVGGQLVVNLPSEVWGVLFLSPLLMGWGVLIYRRLTEKSLHHSRLQILALALVVVLIVALMAALGGGGGNGSVSYNTPTVPLNNTTGGHGGNNSSSGGGSGGSGGSGTSAFHVALPSSTLLIVAGAAAVVVGFLALPGMIGRLVDRRRAAARGGGGAPDRPRVAAALGAAEAALDRGEDPRETIVRLYVELLFVLGTQVDQLDVETAEEIRRLHLAPLGVPPPVAERLTRLFEEARYSTHAFPPETVSEAKDAFRQAAAALRRGGSSPS